MNTKSRKSNKPTKAAPTSAKATQPTKVANPGAVPDTEQNNLVRIHDLTGFAAVCVPAGLRDLIGEEAYERHISNVELHELTLILREPNDVIYIRMPVVHFPLGQGAPAQEAVKTPARKGAKESAKAKGKPAANPPSTTSRKPRPSL